MPIGTGGLVERGVEEGEEQAAAEGVKDEGGGGVNSLPEAEKGPQPTMLPPSDGLAPGDCGLSAAALCGVEPR